MTATSLPVRVRSRGHHHRPLWPARALRKLKQRLMDHNDRMIRDLAREQAAAPNLTVVDAPARQADLDDADGES